MDSNDTATGEHNPIVDQNPEADAREIVEGLGGTWHKSAPGFIPAHGWAPCPVCQPERRPDQRALYVEYRVGVVPLFCDGAGCSVPGIEMALRRSGILTGVRELGYFTFGSDLLKDVERHDEQARRHRRAKHIWEGSRMIQGTPAEAHLRNIGITCDLPDTLRFHAQCWHPDGTRRPAMVALLNREFYCPDGVHITYLSPEGANEDTEVTEVLLGETGQAVTLVDHPYEAMVPIVVADTIPSALALASGLLGGKARIWAALSPEGMTKLRLPEKWLHVDDWSMCYPQLPGHLLVVRNGGEESRKAAEALAEEAHSNNWRVEFLTTYEGHTLVDMLGDDWRPPRWEIPPPAASSGPSKMMDQNTAEPDPTQEQQPEPVQTPDPEPDLADDASDDIPF